MSWRSLLGIVALTLAAFGSWYLAQLYSSDEAPETPAESVIQGYYLKTARIFGTGPEGELVYEILADHAEQLDNKSVSFTDVHVRYAPESDVPWSVNADTALIDPDLPVIRLSGHVVATSESGFGGNDTEIRTRYLELDPEGFIAETDERVQIRIGARSLTATGMLASLRENQLELKSNVSGKFAP